MTQDVNEGLVTVLQLVHVTEQARLRQAAVSTLWGARPPIGSDVDGIIPTLRSTTSLENPICTGKLTSGLGCDSLAMVLSGLK